MGQRVTHVQLGSTDALRAGGVRPAAERQPEPELISKKAKRKRDAARKQGKTLTPQPTALQNPKTRQPKTGPFAQPKKLRNPRRGGPEAMVCTCGWEGQTDQYQAHTTSSGNIGVEHGQVR
jgi:hypothetical protein